MMYTRSISVLAMAVLGVGFGGATQAGSQEFKKTDDRERDSPKLTAATRKPQQAVEEALEFLEKDAVKWRKERGCATCHHGTMTVWALSEARSQRYSVGAESLAEMVEWTKERFVPRFNEPRDPRPGWNLVSVPAIYLGVMSQSLSILSRDEINTVAVHLARHVVWHDLVLLFRCPCSRGWNAGDGAPRRSRRLQTSSH